MPQTFLGVNRPLQQCSADRRGAVEMQSTASLRSRHFCRCGFLVLFGFLFRYPLSCRAPAVLMLETDYVAMDNAAAGALCCPMTYRCVKHTFCYPVRLGYRLLLRRVASSLLQELSSAVLGILHSSINKLLLHFCFVCLSLSSAVLAESWLSRARAKTPTSRSGCCRRW